MTSTDKKEVKNSTILISAIAALVIMNLISIFTTEYFIIKMHNQQQKEYSQKYEKLFETLQQAQSNNKTINIYKENEKKPDDFLNNYYSVQSNWLNIWLTILAIALGVMGIIFPILFADKKKEMDITIEKGEKALKDIETQVVDIIDEHKKDVNDKLATFATDLEKVSDYVKKAEESEKKAEASAIFAMATQYLREKKYNEAMGGYNRAIELNPNYKEAYINRGVIYMEQENYPLAIADVNNAIKLDPDYVLAYCNRGVIYMEQENYSLSIADFNKAMELNPNDSDAFGCRGFVYMKQQNYPLAIADINKAIELNPKNVLNYYNLAEAYIFNKEFDKALDTLNLFVQKDTAPYIFKDDYDIWINALNDFPDDPDVQQIKEIIETKLIKKDRE